MERMIKGFWRDTTLVCANHPDDDKPVMTIQQELKTMYYTCSESSCLNRIHLKEFEGMLNKIFAVLEEADKNNIVMNLTNYTWATRGIRYKILAHANTEVKVSVLNSKALIR